jgi:hypothetical protein
MLHLSFGIPSIHANEQRKRKNCFLNKSENYSAKEAYLIS